VTPGPGDYEGMPPKSIRGGRISTSGAVPSKITPAAPSPGPGEYSPQLSPLPTGAIPFQGRGKTYVDELIIREKKLPGPGQYNFSSKKVRNPNPNPNPNSNSNPNPNPNPNPNSNPNPVEDAHGNHRHLML